VKYQEHGREIWVKVELERVIEIYIDCSRKMHNCHVDAQAMDM